MRIGILDDMRDLIAVCIVEVTGRTWPLCDRCTSAATCSVVATLLCKRCAQVDLERNGSAEVKSLERVPPGSAEIRERALQRLALRIER